MFGKKSYEDFLQSEIPADFFEMANGMTEIYYNLFLFENFLRVFIENVAKEKYGENYWKKLSINKNIKDKINKRKEDEKNKRWLSVRGDSFLFYTDLIELKTIFISNFSLFQKFFPKESWITSKLEDLYDLRNKVAHNSYLTETERQTVETYVNNIYAQLKVKIRYERISNIGFQEEELEEYSESAVVIDYEKITRYLDMIDKDEIVSEIVHDILSFIRREFEKLQFQSYLGNNDLKLVERACNSLRKYYANKNDKIRREILYTLFPLANNEKTKNILKNKWYQNLKTLFQLEEYGSDLIRILDSFGFFSDIETKFNKAIEKKNIELLKMYYSYLDFSKFKEKRFKIFTLLNGKIKSISPEEEKLKEIVIHIIKKVQ